MATFAFRPGDVYSANNANVYPAPVVGAQPAWSDDSDASYAEFGQIVGSRNAQARADFAVDAFAAVASQAVSIVIRAKVQGFNPGALLGLYLFDQAITSVFGNQGLAVPAGGWIETAVMPQAATTDYNVIASGDLRTVLAGPTFALINNMGLPGGISAVDFRVLEVIVIITTAEAMIDPPWLRAMQRSDGLDAGGPPRGVQNTSLRSGITQ